MISNAFNTIQQPWFQSSQFKTYYQKMGQSITDNLPGDSLPQSTLNQLEKRFFISAHPIYSQNVQFKLLHEKLTNKKYILRIITINDQMERNRLEEKILKKMANRNQYLPVLEHYIFQEHKGYCGTIIKCYLFFEIGEFTILREEILKQGTHRAGFTEEQLLKGIENVIYGLLWLRYYKEPHENINTLNIYCKNGTFYLMDPMISPSTNQNPEKYISPEKQQKIENKIQSYDSYISDVYALGMCIMEVVRNGYMDKMYKINGKVNMQLLLSQVEKCRFQRVKEFFVKVLVNGNNTEPREIFLDSFSKRFNASIVTSSQNGERPQKIIGLGGNKRNNRHVQPMQPHQMPVQLQPEMQAQSYHQPYTVQKRVESPQRNVSNFLTTNQINEMNFSKNRSREKVEVNTHVLGTFETSQVLYRINPKVGSQNVTNHEVRAPSNPIRYDHIPMASKNHYPINLAKTNIAPQMPQVPSYRPQSVGKIMPSIDNLINNRPQTSLNNIANDPLPQPQKISTNLNIITKKLEDYLSPLPSYNSYTFKNQSKPFSTNLASTNLNANLNADLNANRTNLTNPSIPYTSSSFLREMNLKNNFESKKPLGNDFGTRYDAELRQSSQSRQSNSSNKKFSLQRKHSEKKHFKEVLQRHDSIKRSIIQSEENSTPGKDGDISDANSFGIDAKLVMSETKTVPRDKPVSQKKPPGQKKKEEVIEEQEEVQSATQTPSKEQKEEKRDQQSGSKKSRTQEKIDFSGDKSINLIKIVDRLESKPQSEQKQSVKKEETSIRDQNPSETSSAKSNRNILQQPISDMKVIVSDNKEENSQLPLSNKKDELEVQQTPAFAKKKQSEDSQIIDLSFSPEKDETANKQDRIHESPNPEPSSVSKSVSQPQSPNESGQFINIFNKNIDSFQVGIKQAFRNSLRQLNNEESANKTNEKGSIIVEESINNSEIMNSQEEERGQSESADIPGIKKTQSSPVVNEASSALTELQPTIIEAPGEEKSETEPTSPQTPLRPYNPVPLIVNNRTIPEEDNESNDDHSAIRIQGQYQEQEYPNGGKYCGFVLNNERNGEGTFYYKDGGFYKGEWKNNQMNGYGKLFYDGGSVAYEGQWYKDQFHGRGKVYNDSAVQLGDPFQYQTFDNYESFWTSYDGDLAHDVKDGHGKMVLSNGEHYTGQFHNDMPHGEGYFHTHDGVIHGVWEQGRMKSIL